MVYIKHWPTFHAKSLELCESRPDRARYLVKAHPSSGYLVLKVTDDSKTIKFRSRSTVILNRLESFNRDMTMVLIRATPPRPR